MSIRLADFQLRTMGELHNAMEDNSISNIVLKSPTGSGKTILLTHFMNEYIMSHKNIVFVWLTPGKAELEKQSKLKMDKYIHNSKTKLLPDIMTAGFEDGDCCFINWEKLTKKGNTAISGSERDNFYDKIDKALDNGLEFKIIIDESHQNFTEKSDTLVQMFKTNKIIRCSATPKIDQKAKLINISESEVISAGLITKLLVINENFPKLVETDNETTYLLDKALDKQKELKQRYVDLGLDINPLIIVQLPNNSEDLRFEVERYFESKGINYENDLALRISGLHINNENIEEKNSNQIALIMKLAVATGWDCPRASILVKLRENMNEDFEIQTIGRIRRMPEAKHYNDDLLDSCYLYTLDEKFTAGVKESMGDKALNRTTLFLKNEYKDIKLVKEQRGVVYDTKDSRRTLNVIASFLKEEYSLNGNKSVNQQKLKDNQFIFNDNVLATALTGSSLVEDLSNDNNLDKINFQLNYDLSKLGREYLNCVTKIGKEIRFDYVTTNKILTFLFSNKVPYAKKLLDLTTRQLYTFVINNFELLKHCFRDAMYKDIKEAEQIALDLHKISTKPFIIPRSINFTYDSTKKVQSVYSKNVYDGYLSSAEVRSQSEKLFEKYCEKSSSVDWFYKNGDKGEEYLSIVYPDNSNFYKLFYPDYIISVNGELWIIETKGSFSRYGESNDIDNFTPKKFNELKRYLKDNNLKGGVVRFDEDSNELCICLDNYNEDIHSDSWLILSDIIK
ncbi:MAG: restriction endonuclease subunit R [Clostridiales bacterium]|nr:restriction endonuclease subunit R [Clostridiales bacterium]